MQSSTKYTQHIPKQK